MTQLLILVGSDGKKVSVPRAIATEASYVLRDLLDCQDVIDDTMSAEDAGDGAGSGARDSDILDLFLPANNNSNNNSTDNTAAAPTAAKQEEKSGKTTASSIEVPFPYCTSGILERVCSHMSYRYRISDFGSEDGRPRVYAHQPRPIPRPMTQPLNDYLDPQDKQFTADWDERLTVTMLKVAVLLNYEFLQRLASAKLASILNDKSVEEIRALLGVENDFSNAEEIEIRKELKS